MHKLYEISEQVCRNLPDELPDGSGIKLVGTDPLRPTSNQVTTSGIHFVTSRGKIVLQGIAATPQRDLQPCRKILYIVADCRESRPFPFDRDAKRIDRFLLDSGAIAYGKTKADLDIIIAQWHIENGVINRMISL